MLFEFLTDNRSEILKQSEKKIQGMATLLPNASGIKHRLPVFYNHVIEVFRTCRDSTSQCDQIIITKSAADHGKVLLRLGYPLSHIVNIYGALCQAITEVAREKVIQFSTQEFQNFNRCLDIALAGTVTEVALNNNHKTGQQEIEHLGLLADKLRNALTSAMISFEMIKKGIASIGGKTDRIVESSFARMLLLIDRSLADVRIRVDPQLHMAFFQLDKLVYQILSTSEMEIKAKNQTIGIHLESNLEVEADRQFLSSALANIIQNALKFTRIGGHIQIRGKTLRDSVELEVEDECGGVPYCSQRKELFKFIQQNGHSHGLAIGLGLSITERAVALSRGKISAKNLPGKGCIFTLKIPKKLSVGKKSSASAA